MRILLITRNLPPLVGGMERLNWHMAEELAKVAEVRIVGPEGSAERAPAGITVREAPLKPLWKFLLRAHLLARREALMWKPGIVLGGSGLTAPLALLAARACGARSAAYVHGLDVAVQHPVYRAIWIPSLRRMDRIIANSGATAELCRGAGIDPSKIGIVHPGVDLPDEPHSPGERSRGEGVDKRGVEDPGQRAANAAATPSPAPSGCFLAEKSANAVFRACHGLANRPLLLSVGRLSARKGLREFVAQCLPRIVAAHPDAMLLIVGDVPRDALHARAETPDSIRAAAESAGVGGRIRFLGKLSDGDLIALYRAVDVHVFPVREIPNDPEGFGMVAVEAAAHGVPTVAFATGGVVDAVAEGRSGHLVPADDYAALADAILRALREREALRDACVQFARQFAWPVFGGHIVRELDQCESPSGAWQ